MMASGPVGRPMTALDERVDGASSGFIRPPKMTSSLDRVGSPNTTTSTKGTPSPSAASAWPPSWTQAWMSLPCA